MHVLGLGLLVCIICRVLVWLGIGTLVGSMRIEGAIMGLCCSGDVLWILPTLVSV